MLYPLSYGRSCRYFPAEKTLQVEYLPVAVFNGLEHMPVSVTVVCHRGTVGS